MAQTIPVYVLVTLKMGEGETVFRQNVGVTFSITEAESHKAHSFENEFDTLSINVDWAEDAAHTMLTLAIREFRSVVDQIAEVDSAS